MDGSKQRFTYGGEENITDLIEAWNRLNPKTGIDDQNRNKFTVTPRKIKWGIYGNYKLRDYLMNLLEILNDDSIVVQVPLTNQKYFQILEKNIKENIKKMVKLI